MPIPASHFAGQPMTLTQCVIGGVATPSDYQVMCAGHRVARIRNETIPGGARAWVWFLRYHWPIPSNRDGRCETLAEAKAAVRKAFDAWLQQAGDEGVMFWTEER